MNVFQEAAKKADTARKRQRKSADKSKDSKSAEAKPKSSKVSVVPFGPLLVYWNTASIDLHRELRQSPSRQRTGMLLLTN